MLTHNTETQRRGDKYHLYEVLSELKKEESSLRFENNFLISKVSNLRIYSPNLYDEEYNNIAFTQEFNEMVDLLHFGICTGTPIIMEGFPGQGKQKVINYISHAAPFCYKYIANLFIFFSKLSFYFFINFL